MTGKGRGKKEKGEWKKNRIGSTFGYYYGFFLSRLGRKVKKKDDDESG